MTLAEWVAALDGRLKDSGNALFTVAEKEAHVATAVGEYSRWRPRRFSHRLTTVAGQQRYPLPAGCLWVVEVILPPPAVATETTLPGWLEADGELLLFPTPEEEGLPVAITCAGAWTVEMVPPEESETVLLAAHARCCEVLASETARAFAFWVGSEKFDKSQVSEQYRQLARDLRAECRRRLALG